VKRIALAAGSAIAALAGLAACTHAAAGGPAHPGQQPAGQRAAALPATCGQQYSAWASAGGRSVLGSLHAVSVAEAAGNAQALTVALRAARPAVAQAALHPVPACADPKGYWTVLLMHVSAAAGSAGSAPGARAALTGVPGIEQELTAELRDASG
jgi:hypothetical protein